MLYNLIFHRVPCNIYYYILPHLTALSEGSCHCIVKMDNNPSAVNTSTYRPKQIESLSLFSFLAFVNKGIGKGSLSIHIAMNVMFCLFLKFLVTLCTEYFGFLVPVN